VSDLVSGHFHVGVVSTLPVKGVTLLLGNNIAGGNITPVLEVVDNPEIKTTDDKLVQAFPHVFLACVLTRAQSHKLGDVVDLTSSIFEKVEVEDNALSIPSARPMVFTPVKTKAGESKIAHQLHDILLSFNPRK
jgi:hypothetical protein